MTVESRSLFSVCIPAYNRAKYLEPLLASILKQGFQSYEILICEDKSPERALIREIVEIQQAKFPGKIRYIENEFNLGYDGNLRNLVEHAKGQYCIFMGNDDLMCSGSLGCIEDIVSRNAECGVIVRTYATFDDDPSTYKQLFRYFPSEYKITAGADAVATAFRRSVVIPGMVIHRDSAAALATNKFDGSLLYQLYLVGLIASKRSVVFTPQIVALRRDGVSPDFGNSDAEQGKFIPSEQTPESSLHFMSEMLRIAAYVERISNLEVYAAIKKDIASYSYPILSIQACRSRMVFFNYGRKLAKLGFGKSVHFQAYFISLLLFGPRVIDKCIKFIKVYLGYTPRFGAAKGKKR